MLQSWNDTPSNHKYCEQRRKECLFEFTCPNKHDCWECPFFEVVEKITPWDRTRKFLKEGRDDL